jgi:hypothetical protein
MAGDLARIVDSRRMADHLSGLAGDYAKVGEMVGLRLRATSVAGGEDADHREN